MWATFEGCFCIPFNVCIWSACVDRWFEVWMSSTRRCCQKCLRRMSSRWTRMSNMLCMFRVYSSKLIEVDDEWSGKTLVEFEIDLASTESRSTVKRFSSVPKATRSYFAMMHSALATIAVSSTLSSFTNRFVTMTTTTHSHWIRHFDHSRLKCCCPTCISLFNRI